jgi:hypothetical protein
MEASDLEPMKRRGGSSLSLKGVGRKVAERGFGAGVGRVGAGRLVAHLGRRRDVLPG